MPAAFDPLAYSYDAEFSQTPIGRVLRGVVQARLAVHFHAGMRVLELGCGTGEDAVALAQRGVAVTATDVSAAMLEVTRAKAERAGAGRLIEARILNLNAAAQDAFGPASFDGVLSNFGALNCVSDLRALLERLACWTGRGAVCVLVVMGPFCAWEIAWHLAHLRPRTAFRRWAPGGLTAQVGGNAVRVWYPSAGRLARAAAPHFRLMRLGGLGLFVPPPYTRLTRGLALAARLDGMLAQRAPFNRCGDHYIAELLRI